MKQSEEYQESSEGNHVLFTWCLHCECVNKTELWVKNKWQCPGKGCHGSALDAHLWMEGEWPRNAHPEYPEIPEEGAYYPLYER